MYLMNGVVYAGNPTNDIMVQTVKVLDDMMMIVIFTSGEKKLFNATILLSMPAFKVLENVDIFITAAVEHGVVVWNNGDIDIAPEYMYNNCLV